MKTPCLAAALLFPLLCHAGECVGHDPCKACADCSQCKFCDPKNPKGGSCGTIRAQNAAQEKARQKKRER